MHKRHSHFKLQKFDENFSYIYVCIYTRIYICVHLSRFSLRRHELMTEHHFCTQHIHQTQASSKMWHAAERTHISQQHEQPGINRSQVISKLQTLAKIYK